MNEVIIDGIRRRELEEFPGYWIGEDGTPWTRKLTGQCFNGIEYAWKQKACMVKKKYKYRRVSLWHKGKNYPRAISHLVLTAFVGPCPVGMESCHNNGNTEDNRLSNLRWDTHKNNCADKIKHGTYQGGANHPSARCNHAMMEEILRLINAGVSQREVCRIVGISTLIIRQLIRGTHWLQRV